MEYIVQIKTYADEKVMKELGPFNNKRMAEKCDDGVNINLNHEYCYTVIIEKATPKNGL